MRSIKNYLIASMIGFGIFSNANGQETVKEYEKPKEVSALENAFKKNNLLDSIILTTNSMIPSYNQCVRNGTKSDTDSCEKIFLVRLATCDSLLHKFKELSSQPIKKDFYEAENGYYFGEGPIAFTDENANQLLDVNGKFYTSTKFLIENPSQKNYKNWQNELERYKQDCRTIFGQE